MASETPDADERTGTALVLASDTSDQRIRIEEEAPPHLSALRVTTALLVVLWAITYVLSNIFIKNWLRLRERSHTAA